MDGQIGNQPQHLDNALLWPRRLGQSVAIRTACAPASAAARIAARGRRERRKDGHWHFIRARQRRDLGAIAVAACRQVAEYKCDTQ
eukprot:362942-Chlamydomonas_euryale.AAC.3